MIQPDYMPVSYNAGTYAAYRPYGAYGSPHYGGYGHGTPAYPSLVIPPPVYGYGFPSRY